LAKRGVRHGDRILLHARNSNAVLESMFAAWMLGATWVPTNFRLTPPEVAYLAVSSGASVHIFDDAFPEHAATAKAENPACRLEISIPDGWESLATGADKITRPADVDRDHPAWFFYTSGTTGRPKAGMLTHGQMDYVICNHLCDLMPSTTEHDVSLVVAPLSHGAGVHALPQIARGAATVLMPSERFDVEEAWRLVERHRADDPDDADPARFRRPARSFQSALRDLRRRADVSRRSGARAGETRTCPGAVFRHGRGDRQHHRAAAVMSQYQR
jgi:acyl-CoA synthetase (AMP-forming)/AMP-acid ligase II